MSATVVGPATAADAVDRRQDAVVDLWLDLGSDGPIFGTDEAGTAEQARERYLRPLVRVLVGALRGSAAHRAVYLDERLRYLPADLDEADRRARLRDALSREIPAVAGLVADAPELETALRALHRDLLEPAADATRVLFVGDCVFVETRAFLTPQARAAGHPVDVRQAFFSAHQQLERRDSAITALVRSHRPELVGLSLFTFGGIPPWTAAWRRAANPLAGRPDPGLVAALAQVVHDTVEDVRAVSDCPIVIHSPCGLPLDRVRRRISQLPAQSGGQRRLLAELAGALRALVDGTENTVLLDERELVASTGIRDAGQPVFDAADVPAGYFHTTRLGPRLADWYDGFVADWRMVGRAKALFVDFDNTLWRGVMAEGDVEHDLAGQRLLKRLRDSGVLLVALSKNSPASIRWDEMVLQPDDFVLQQINWAPKPDNVREAVERLDLAPEAFVLLDDNPAERALVTENVRGLRALDPADASTWRALRRWLDFPSTTQTEEARRRTTMYREAAARRTALSGGQDYAAMMRSLQLVFGFRAATSADLPRLLELFQRTNQFNTTTRRQSTGEIDAMLTAPQTGLYVASLRDRFGDLGVVAAAVFDRTTRTVDSFVMSCRAMGFGLETSFLARVLDAEDAGDVTGLFVPTDRNAPAAALFAQAGFNETDAGTWVLTARDARPAVAAWFRVQD